MLRYIIGVSLIAIAIMLIRRLAAGRMPRRYQYALWLLIPLYMIASPFIKINVTVTEEISSLIPANVEQAIYEKVYSNDALPYQDFEKDDASDMIFGMTDEQAVTSEKAASGITAAAPTFCRSRATFRSGFIYGKTTNPSFARICVALIVS